MSSWLLLSLMTVASGNFSEECAVTVDHHRLRAACWNQS